MKIIFDFITMMLINHISNMHSNRFLKNNCTFFFFFWLSRLVQVGESRWNIEYSPFSKQCSFMGLCFFFFLSLQILFWIYHFLLQHSCYYCTVPCPHFIIFIPITLTCNAAHRHITQKSMEQKLLNCSGGEFEAAYTTAVVARKAFQTLLPMAGSAEERFCSRMSCHRQTDTTKWINI
jgi:apolipoprotein N-acyltransferase